MKYRISQALILIVTAVIIGLVVNAISGRGIPLKGNWPSISNSDSIAVPPSAGEDDPPFISLDEAAALYQSPKVLFIDARSDEDYNLRHITGSINIPYDYLPFDNIDEYWEQLKKEIPIEQEIVIYCSGSECELSLFLGRDMNSLGYDRIKIFYGGWREWERAGLPTEGMSNDE
jgi:rhodanese-related sulfurtransferase